MYKNHIDLIGFIGSDPEAHQTSSGTAVANLSLATKSSWKNESGTYDSRTEWHRIVLWGKLAEADAKVAKGAYIEVEGELRHRSYQKEVSAGKKAVAVDIPVTGVHARILSRLDRSTTPADSEVTEENAFNAVRRAQGRFDSSEPRGTSSPCCLIGNVLWGR